MPSLFILASAVLYGASPILAKVAYAHGVSTLAFLALRSTFATGCLWLALVANRRSIRLPIPSLAALLITGTTLIPVQVFGYFWALTAFPASSASVLVYTFPLHVAWMGWIFLGERIRRDEVGVLIAVVAGALLVAGQTPVPAGGNLQLVALAVSTLTAGLYMVVARRLVRDVEPVTAMAILAPATAATYWGVGAATGQLQLSMPATALGATLGSAALANIAAPLLLLSALRSVPAARAAMLGTLEPVVTVSLSVIFLGDTMTALRALGIAIVIGGIAMLQARRASELPRVDRT
jgi:drug/metabolite transporter (DMT)-like permease